MVLAQAGRQAGAASNDRIAIISKIILLTSDGMFCRHEIQESMILPVASWALIWKVMPRPRGWVLVSLLVHGWIGARAM